MLRSNAIPQYNETPATWCRFLEKAAKGSIKAAETLWRAQLAYMVDLTNDPDSPDTLLLDDYDTIFRKSFPPSPPKATVTELVQLGVELEWFPHSFVVSDTPRQERSYYCNLWGRLPVDWEDLVNDALLGCLSPWSADNSSNYMSPHSVDYDAREVVSGMLFLALTWPEPESESKPNR
jgi:hypothetical protein